MDNNRFWSTASLSTINLLKPIRHNAQTCFIKVVEAAGPTMAGYLIERQVQASSKRSSGTSVGCSRPD
jgi:hypothetical protein